MSHIESQKQLVEKLIRNQDEKRLRAIAQINPMPEFEIQPEAATEPQNSAGGLLYSSIIIVAAVLSTAMLRSCADQDSQAVFEAKAQIIQIEREHANDSLYAAAKGDRQ
ncbi:hypothetical protein LVY74_02190 [Acinetobacter sp. ME22]|uniref:hypothetical protein n=1 Tax=Acinetobacter sp. ME22 TaxID=2904802 RepID=UPI001EDA2781|nr:hypothetical protein [Acinetobacter sp. ME22]MCG2572367.1 hypothetical protein [Acinetobacter sp. ME22]